MGKEHICVDLELKRPGAFSHNLYSVSELSSCMMSIVIDLRQLQMTIKFQMYKRSGYNSAPSHIVLRLNQQKQNRLYSRKSIQSTTSHNI